MDGLLERIEENKLDALYLFINETLRDQVEFDRFYVNLLQVLPQNWSIQRLEIGHEFLSMVNVHDFGIAVQQQPRQQQVGGDEVDVGNQPQLPAQAQAPQQAPQPPPPPPRPSPNTHGSYTRQYQLFEKLCNLESLRTLIISDGYVPRKDNGSVNTNALLENLPSARNLVNLDLQRLRLESKSQISLLADVFHSLEESLEEIRITGLSLGYETGSSGRGEDETILRIDDAIQVCVEMDNLRSLAISSQSRCNHHQLRRQRQEQNQNQNQNPQQNQNQNQQIQNQQPAGEANNDDQNQNQNQQRPQPQQQNQQQVLPNAAAVAAAAAAGAANAAATTTTADTTTTTMTILSQHVLVDLIKKSTTLQDLALRAMHLDDATCKTIAAALHKNSDGSFLTSLDIRQNPAITIEGYKAILTSLEQNYDLWCSVMVDNHSFQGKFNSLIELNQANRGDLVRNPSREKLVEFLDRLNEQSPRGVADGTSLWYFLTIHESILRPLVSFLKWKHGREQQQQQQQQAAAALPPAASGGAEIRIADAVIDNDDDNDDIIDDDNDRKRPAASAVLDARADLGSLSSEDDEDIDNDNVDVTDSGENKRLKLT
mmetsp:Transcript_10692/g.25509  ORF Transcript_10692/g.25509 Transcript_10692/m.25509 type:complete len:599 (-) Transcript_10692:222-2018(-)|eukprot:CAMPEP_0113462660 /NCGR_PEP_ID=MMETSP0014_2-20120614/12224_1 /TAXON_ID=2857 /ORGANISM="Nitzschia sp." /LENGTH=598 /DNA_ID=CAMNT_0000354565 /DNA_START=253 /DNA_END=2049 /DNA_ORIENTATION=- /assembly_acc=CAM_ASM_000159